jgi:hypothetical protein
LPTRYALTSLLLMTIGLLLVSRALGNSVLTNYAVKRLPPAVKAVRHVNPCPSERCVERFGVGGESRNMLNSLQAGLPFGVYYDWFAAADPPLNSRLEYWQMIRTTAKGSSISFDEIAAIIKSRPGSVWIIGNEPDNIWQDNIEAEEYASLYHEIYHFIKGRDPSAAIAIAAVSQPTPLRLEYLERVLDAYRESYGTPMPVDIWTIHGYILREEVDSWGAGIPPGFDDVSGELYEIEDHADFEIFEENLLQFRAWMDQEGYGERPLAVTELGVLLPKDYGFSDEVIGKFMIEAFDFLSNSSGEYGWEQDDNRLFQWWFWYSLYDNYVFPTGDLFDSEQQVLTPLGKIMRDYIRGDQKFGG